MYDSGEDAATSVRAYRDSLSRGARALVGPSYSSITKNLALLGGIDQARLWGLSYPILSRVILLYPRLCPISRANLSRAGLSYPLSSSIPIHGYPIHGYPIHGYQLEQTRDRKTEIEVALSTC